MASNPDSEADLFTFRIGPKKQIFQVDKNVIAKSSPVLDRMMNSGMKETNESSADLPEVAPVTFVTFLNFAYHVAEVQHNPSESIAYVDRGAVILGPLVVLMIDAGHKDFRCRSCGLPAILQMTKTIPFCTECFKKGPCISGYRAACIVGTCGKQPCTYAFGMLCEGCANAVGLLALAGHSYRLKENAAQLLLPEIHGIQGEVEFFRFDVPMLAKEAVQEMRRIFDMTCTKEPAEMLKLFSFADLYGISSLRKLAVLELFQALALGEVAPDTLAHLVKLVYEVTSDSGNEVAFAEKHVLRRLVSAYVAYHAQALQISPGIADLLSDAGEFGTDLFMAMSIIASGKLGKGWKNE